jgi:hypothetical protein
MMTTNENATWREKSREYEAACIAADRLEGDARNKAFAHARTLFAALKPFREAKADPCTEAHWIEELADAVAMEWFNRRLSHGDWQLWSAWIDRGCSGEQPPGATSGIQSLVDRLSFVQTKQEAVVSPVARLNGKPPANRRGRPKAGYDEAQSEEEIYRMWEASSGSRTKSEFAGDMDMDTKELERLLDRVRKRKTAAE